MASRVIYSYGGGQEFRELFAGLLTTQLLAPALPQPVYLVVPALADVLVVDNTCRQIAALLPAWADQPRMRLSQVMAELARRGEVRTVTERGTSSYINARASVRLSTNTAHLPNGLLADSFFLEGTFRFAADDEPMVAGERVVLHTSEGDPAAKRIIAAARESLDRVWPTLRSNGEGAHG